MIRNLLKKFFAGLIAIVFIFNSTNTYAATKDELLQDVSFVHSIASSMNSYASFRNRCLAYVKMEMKAAGLCQNFSNNAKANEFFGFASTQTQTDKGYQVISRAGKNSLKELYNEYAVNGELRYLVVTFPHEHKKTMSDPGAGHIVFINAIKDNEVYFSESFGHSYFGEWVPEGNPMCVNIDRFLSAYIKDYGDPIGTNLFRLPPPAYETGWLKGEDGAWRWRLTDGSFHTGWLVDGQHTYYLKTDTATLVQNKFYKIDDEMFYFNDNGEMVTGWIKSQGDYYYMGDDGVRQKSRWIQEGSKWYYVANDGTMLRNVCSRIDGVEYDFNNSGEATAIEEKNISKATEYSYRTRTKEYEYTTSNKDFLEGWEFVETVNGGSGEWGAWSNWSNEYVEGSDDRKVEKRTVDTGSMEQIYLGRYYSESKNKFSPDKLDSSYSFEGGWFNKEEVNFVGQAFSGGRSDCYTIPGYHYYFFEVGQHGGEVRQVSTGSQTEYRYRERQASTKYKFRKYKFSDWSKWSSWSKTPVESNELRDVRTR